MSDVHPVRDATDSLADQPRSRRGIPPHLAAHAVLMVALILGAVGLTHGIDHTATKAAGEDAAAHAQPAAAVPQG